MAAPAARKGDRVTATDTHIVVVPSPPGSAALPHPFSGILDGNLVSDVLVDGEPAAVMGSTATNSPGHLPAPPGTQFLRQPSNQAAITAGSATVYLGGKPAARAGDIAKTCNDPVDLPLGQVVVSGGTVMIG